VKVLTAVAVPPNAQGSDFCFADDGEIVVPNPAGVCGNPECGCRGAAMGLKSRRETTTMQVSDQDLTEDDIANLLQGYNERTWSGRLDQAVLRSWWDAAAVIAANAPAGAVLRIRAEERRWVVDIDAGARSE